MTLSILLTEIVATNEWTKPQVITSLASAFISLCSLLIAYTILRNADAKKTVIKLQIEKVYELFTALEKTTFNFRTHTDGNTTPYITHIASTFGIAHKEFLYIEPFVIDSQLLLDFEIMKFIHDPFLPFSIATELHKFILIDGIGMNTNISNYVSVMIITNKKDSKFSEFHDPNMRTFIIAKDKTYQTAATFIGQIYALKGSINLWLTSKGITDINNTFIYRDNKPI